MFTEITREKDWWTVMTFLPAASCTLYLIFVSHQVVTIARQTPLKPCLEARRSNNEGTDKKKTRKVQAITLKTWEVVSSPPPSSLQIAAG